MAQKAVTLRLGERLLKRVDKAADEEEMSRAEYIRTCLRNNTTLLLEEDRKKGRRIFVKTERQEME